MPIPRNLKVLLVDDNPNIKDKIDSIFAQGTRYRSGDTPRYGYESYTLEHTLTPEQGIERLETLKPDLVLLDINYTPTGNDRRGITNFLVPTRKSGNKVPIICISSEPAHRSEVRERGADEFIDKDYLEHGAMEMLDTVKAVFGYRDIMLSQKPNSKDK